MSAGMLSRRDDPGPRPTVAHFETYAKTRASTLGSGADGRGSHVVGEQRLHQIVVFELREDGTTEYSTMTLRALYNYVVRTITEACREANTERNNHGHQHHRHEDHRHGEDNERGSSKQEQGHHHINFHGQNVSSRAVFSSDTVPMAGIDVIEEDEEGEHTHENNNDSDPNNGIINSPTTHHCNTPTTPNNNNVPPHLPSLTSSTNASSETPPSSSENRNGISNTRTPITSPNSSSNLHQPHLPSLTSSTNASSDTPPSSSENRPTPIMSNQSSDQLDPARDSSRSHHHQGSSSQNRQQQQSYSQSNRPQQRAAQTAFTPLPTNNSNGGAHRERLGGYLHPRDMRRLVTPFSSSNEPQLMVRRHVMLLNFDPLRAVVLRDRLLVLVPDGADSILIALERRVRGGIREMEDQVFGTSAHDGTAGAGAGAVGPPPTKHATAGEGARLTNGKRNRSYEEFAKMSIGGEGDRDGRTVESQHGISNNDVHRTESSSSALSNATTETDITPTIHSNGDEWEDIQKMDWKHMPYELQSVDAVLQTVVAMLADDARKVYVRSARAMGELRGDSSNGTRSRMGGIGEHAQERLRLHKDEANLMEGRVQGFVRAMNDVLDDDEDMTLMNLSRLLTHPERFLQPVPPGILHEESDEPELMLEAYLQQALGIVNELGLLKGQIMTTEEQISMTLDAVRNRLLYINTLLSVASLCVAVGSFVGSIFGMNLANHIENQPTAFVRVTAGVIVGMVCMWGMLSWIFYRAANIHSDYGSNRRKTGSVL